MSSVSPTELVSCGCIKKLPQFPAEDKDYVQVKKQHLTHVITELVLHSSEHLVGVKHCYGKHHASVNILKSVCVSHSKSLQRLQANIVAFESRENKILYSNTPKPLCLRQYFDCSYEVCKLFHKTLTNLFQASDKIPIELVIACIKSEQLTLSFLEDILTKNEHNE
jgi:hypothetical protein